MAVYTAIDDPSAFFQIALYSGSGSQQSITNDGNSDLQPDWLWIKERDGTSSHQLVDSVRLYYNRLESDNASAELDAGQTGATNQNVTSFDSDGFGVKNGAAVNESGKTYVAWQWKAGTTASGTTGGSGTGKSYSYSANTTSGFSVVTYTGNATAGHLIPHGMSKVPRLIHVKSRGDDNGWQSGTIVSASAWNDHGYLYLNNAFGTDANQFGATPDSTNFRLGTGTGTNGNNGTRVAYCFADVQGYQKIGKYVGNGNANGTFVYCGFKPAYVIAKNLGAAKSWFIYDNKRDPFNPTVEKLRADTSAAEATGTDKLIDMYSNGFKIRTDDAEFNTSGANYLFHAIAENPFVTSTGVPTTAR